MKFNIIMLVVMVVITIIYLAFSIWNTFISKKQVVMSVVDVGYSIFLGGFIGAVIVEKNYRSVAIIEIFVIAIWLIIVSIQWKKNYNKKYKTQN